MLSQPSVTFTYLPMQGQWENACAACWGLPIATDVQITDADPTPNNQLIQGWSRRSFVIGFVPACRWISEKPIYSRFEMLIANVKLLEVLQSKRKIGEIFLINWMVPVGCNWDSSLNKSFVWSRERWNFPTKWSKRSKIFCIRRPRRRMIRPFYIIDKK